MSFTKNADGSTTDLGAMVKALLAGAPDLLTRIEEVRDLLHEASPVNSQPVDRIRWVPIDMVTPNSYNPNSVAGREMKLLYHSIKHDGYTQPVVTVWDEAQGKYCIVDGFHRYFTCKTNKDIYERNQGRLPIVVIDKDINDRMASTVRHNRARGKHSVAGMSNMVFEMLENGMTDAEICNQLGMEPEELLRLKHITGFAKLFENVQYRQAWKTKRQILLEKGLVVQAAALPEDEEEAQPAVNAAPAAA